MEETLFALCVGIGLSAACGFRIFVPMLGLSLASQAGHLELAEGFAWIATPTASIAFGVATALEIGAYYIPWLDNLMDSIATPAAIVAGTIATGSMTGEMSPFLNWSIALIAGGGTAGVVQGASVMIRGASSATTGGMANPLVSTGELAGAATVTFMAVFIPALAACLVAAIICWIVVKFYKKLKSKKKQPLELNKAAE